MSPDDLDRFSRLFQPPDREELTSSEIDAPPASSMWRHWGIDALAFIDLLTSET
jgi:hypothetical protein